jgi:copper chaperone CopZ
MNPAQQPPDKEIKKMFRRRFLQIAAMASFGGLAPLEATAATNTVTWFVKGFSCITCATGLDTLLSQQKGIVSSKSTYPEGKVTVAFHPDQVTRQAIVQFIVDLGFTVEG